VVRREVHNEVPPKVEYSLTEYGIALNGALRPLGAWGREHKERLEKIRSNAQEDKSPTSSPNFS
jgi:DNA-binding HxlR family transcriptional regulator